MKIVGQSWVKLIPAESLIYYHLLVPDSVPVQNYYKPRCFFFMVGSKIELRSRQ